MIRNDVLKKTTVKVAAAVITASIAFNSPVTVYAFETYSDEEVAAMEPSATTSLPAVSPINGTACINNGLTLPVIGTLGGVFNIDGTYTLATDNGNPPAAVANNGGTILVAMYQGDTINLNYELNGTMVPQFFASQNGFVSGNPAFDGIAFTANTVGVDAIFFNVYSDATHTVLLSQFSIVVNVLPAQATSTTVDDSQEVLTPAQAEQYTLQLVNEARIERGLAPYEYRQDIADDLYSVIPTFADTKGQAYKTGDFGLSGGSYACATQYFGQTLTKSVVRRMYKASVRSVITSSNTLFSDGKLYFGAAFYNNGKGWYGMIGACTDSRYRTNEDLAAECAEFEAEFDWSIFD